MDIVTIEWCKLDERATIPTKKNQTDAGFDFYSMEDKTILPMDSILIDTGIAWQPRFSYKYEINHEITNIYLQLKSRSGLSCKSCIDLCNAGVIDEEYKGSICLRLYNFGKHTYVVRKGDRVAQGIVLTTPKTASLEINKDDLLNSERGDNGLGSSGK